ncbi:cation-binding protein [Clostridium acetobutylicum]|nr:cation-binding protein [Clostridium acetobutylicum]
MYIDNLKRQHTEIYSSIKMLKGFIDKKISEEDYAEMAKTVSVLAGILKVHLQSEDKFLYPELLKNKDEAISNMAKEYIDDMGNIGKKFEEYKNKYNTKIKVCDNVLSLKKDTEEVLNLLVNRLNKEDKALYPLIN